jgi:FG-GAP-like repeat/Bacterial Ig-like domain
MKFALAPRNRRRCLALERLEQRLLLDATVVDFARTVLDVGEAPDAAALADLNADGFLDIVTVDTVDDTVSVLLGAGDGTFAAAVAYDAGNEPVAVVATDLDGDGALDLAIAHDTSVGLTILLGAGDGTLGEPTTIAGSSYLRGIVVGDFNEDGDADLALSSWGSNEVVIMIGNGNGTFDDPVEMHVASRPIGIVVADFDADGHQDLATANATGDDVSVLLGVGDGTFAEEVRYDAYDSPAGLASGDFNGDGYADLVVTNDRTDDVSVLLGVGDGTFEEDVLYSMGENPYGVVVADFDGDGVADIAVANSTDDNLLLRLGVGDGTFGDPRATTLGDRPRGLVVGDINGDGLLDIVAAESYDDTVGVLLNEGTHDAPAVTVVLQAATDSGESDSDGITNHVRPSFDITVNMGGDLTVDWDGDGVIDMQRTYAVAGDYVLVPETDLGEGEQPVLVTFTATPDGQDDSETARADAPVTIDATGPRVVHSQPSTVVYTQIDEIVLTLEDDTGLWAATVIDAFYYELLEAGGDGSFGEGNETDLSALISGWGYTSSSKTATLTLSEPITAGALQLTVRSTAGVRDIAGNELDGDEDGLPGGDYVVQFTVRVSSLVAGFMPATAYDVGAGPAAVAAADFDGDGVMDVAVASALDDSVSVLLGTGSGGLAPATTVLAGDEPRALVAGDVTGDGVPDLVVALTDANAVGVLRGLGDGTFAPIVTYAVGADPVDVLIADLDDDGLPDIVAANSDGGSVSVLLGSGGGAFAAASDFAAGAAPSGVAAADVNGDGDLDLIVAATGDDAVLVLTGSGSGTFAAPTVHAVGNGPTDVVATDLDGDGDVDLAVLNAYDGTVSVLRGSGDGTFATPFARSVGPLPGGLSAVDLNGDGLPDFVVTSRATNEAIVLFADGVGHYSETWPHAVGVQPGGVLAADLNGDDLPDLLVADYGGDTLSVLLNDGTGQEPLMEASLRGSSDSGPASDDGVTNDSTPTFDVSVNQAGALHVDWDGDGEIDFDLLIGAAGVNQVTPDGVLPDGEYAVRFSFVAGGGTAISEVPITIDLVGPVVADVVPEGTVDEEVSAIEIVFDDAGAMWESTVTDPTNYALLAAGGDGEYAAGNEVDIASHITSIDYDAETSTATLNLDIPLGDDEYRLTVTGTSTVRDAAGNALDGDGNDIRGGNFVTTFTVDTDGPAITYHSETFETDEMLYGWDERPSAVASGDLNGDGILDIVAAMSNEFRIVVMLGQEDGWFGEPTTYWVGSAPIDIEIGDINSDGILDVVCANSGFWTVSTFLGFGDGQLWKRTDLFMGDAPADVLLTDLNGDGSLDLVTANSGGDNVSVRFGLNGSYFGGLQQYDVDDQPFGVTAGDLDGDGLQDLVVACVSGDNLSILMAQEDGTFADAESLDVGNGPYDVAVADMDGDEYLDLVVVNFFDNDVSVHYGQENGNFDVRRDFATPAGPVSVELADMDGDGRRDIVVACLSANSVAVLFGNTAGGFSQRIYAVGEGPQSVHVANLDGAGRLDMITADASADTLTLLLSEPRVDELFTSFNLEQVVDHGMTGVDDTEYLFKMRIETSSDVEGLSFTTPEGTEFTFETAESYRDGGLRTTWLVEGDTIVWTYEASFNEEAGLDAFGDGAYDFVAAFGGFDIETSVPFTLLDSNDSIPGPTLEPVMEGPADGALLSDGVTQLTWQDSDDVNAQSVFVELSGPGTELREEFGVGETQWTIDASAPGHWSVLLGTLHAFEGDNVDGVAFTVGKSSQTQSDFTILTGVGDVVELIDIAHLRDYGDGAEAATWDVEIEILTSPGVERVLFTTPGSGETWQIVPEASVVDGETETRYFRNAEGSHWIFLGTFSDPADLAAFGDGEYDFTIAVPGDDLETSVFFGEPGTADPLGQPIQQPVLLHPYSAVTTGSPLVVEWTGCTDAEATGVTLQVTDSSLDEAVADESFAKDATASGDVNLPDGVHMLTLGFEQAYDSVNADGIAVHVAKVSESDRSFRIITPLEIREEAGVSVAIYDIDDDADVNPEDVEIVFYPWGGIASITLVGDQAMTGLGLAISGAYSVDSVIDMREGDAGDIAFIVADCAISSVSLQSGMTGLDLNGYTINGVAVGPDADGDGATDDPVAILSEGWVRALTFEHGDVAGDVVVRSGNLTSLDVIDGDLAGDVAVREGSITSVRAQARHRGGQWQGGDITGDITAFYRIGEVAADGGDLAGDVQSTNADIGEVRAVSVSDTEDGLKGGSIVGNVEAATTLLSATATGGDISGDITAGGYLGSVTTTKLYDAANEIFRGGGLSGNVSAGSVLSTLSADAHMTGDLNVGAWLGTATIGGNLERCTVSVAGSAYSVQVGGNLERATVSVDSSLALLSVTGNFIGGNVEAGILTRIAVQGIIREEPGDGEDAIHAALGSFLISDVTWSGTISQGSEHEFEGLRAYVGDV